MGEKVTFDKKKEHKGRTFLVGIDFSDCARDALHTAISFLTENPGRIIALHVINHDFITECIHHELGDAAEIKKKLFLDAKTKLHEFLKQENTEENHMEMAVCEGTPFLEINRKAVENNVDMIIVGSCGKSGDMSQIFFGSTAEKILRFISRPVLCVPPDTEYKYGCPK